MKTKTRKFLQRGLQSVLLGACLSLAVAADAQAHKPGYKPYAVHRYYAHSRPAVFPRWLARDYAFQRWFVKNRARLHPNISWQRRYEIFRLEKPHRLRMKKIRGRIVYDYGYRSYWIRSKRW